MGDQFCEQFSCECLHWYYENVQQTICHPFVVEDIEFLMRDCPTVKKIPGLTIILEARCLDDDLERLIETIDRFKATGYFDDLKRDFKVRVYIDIILHPMWRSANINVERSVVVTRGVIQYFKTRTENALCFARLMDAEEYEVREEGLDITQYMEESLDDILERLGFLVIVGLECAPPRYVEVQ